MTDSIEQVISDINSTASINMKLFSEGFYKKEAYLSAFKDVKGKLSDFDDASLSTAVIRLGQLSHKDRDYGAKLDKASQIICDSLKEYAMYKTMYTIENRGAEEPAHIGLIIMNPSATEYFENMALLADNLKKEFGTVSIGVFCETMAKIKGKYTDTFPISEAKLISDDHMNTSISMFRP